MLSHSRDIQLPNSESIVHAAARNGNLELLKHCLDKLEVDPNLKNVNNNTILHIAVENNDTEMAKYLLSRDDVNIAAQNSLSVTAIELAEKSRNESIQSMFSKEKLFGVDVNTKEKKQGWTDYAWSFFSASSSEIPAQLRAQYYINAYYENKIFKMQNDVLRLQLYLSGMSHNYPKDLLGCAPAEITKEHLEGVANNFQERLTKIQDGFDEFSIEFDSNIYSDLSFNILN